jgi:uncharacterized Rmd1/YagE family protein
MNQTAPHIVTVPGTVRHRLQAYSAHDQINLETIKTQLLPGPGRLERYNRDCLIFHRYEDEKIFIFNFGTAVFFNIPPAEHSHYLTKLGISYSIVPSTLGGQSSNQDEITADDFSIQIETGGSTRVGFNSVTLGEFDLVKVQIVAQVLAQSSALELIEREVEAFLAESEKMTHLFKSRSRFRSNREKLTAFLGESLSARHRIVTQLSLLKEPDKTWEKEDLYILYKGIFANFEIVERIEKIERMFELTSQVTELLLEIVNARRAELLEITIIILIMLEIIRPVFGL